MRKRNNNPTFTLAQALRIRGAALICGALCAGSPVRAAVFRCVDANGVNTYADRPCPPNESEKQRQVVSSTDQEAALEYVRHLSFEAPTEEECQTIKMQMVAKFHMALDSSGDWTTIFDVHPVYSFNGDRVVVNPN